MTLQDCLHNAWTSLLSAMGTLPDMLLRGRKVFHFARFRDRSGNFEILYPRNWKYDQRIAVVDANYTIAFESWNGQEKFVVAVNCGIPAGFDFGKYAKKELESPAAGIIATPEKGRFRKMECFRREYRYVSCGRRFSGGGLMFYTGDAVFSLSWNAPESGKEIMDAVFGHMIESLVVRESPALRKQKRQVHNKMMEMEAVSAIKET